MDEIGECYRILDLEPGASLEDVKRSYRELVKVWHPDRFRGDPKLQAKAEEKLKRINLAYERLNKEAASKPRRTEASPEPKKPYPQRPRPEPRATQDQSAKNTQTHVPPAQPRSAPSVGHTADRFFRWIRQPRVIGALVAFVIIVVGVIVIAALIVDKVQTARREKTDVATTPAPKIENAPIEKNEKLAQLLKAAAQGDAAAEAALALAFEQYQKDATRGDANAQIYLGLMYDQGRGVPIDHAKAVEWYRKAAAQGNAYAQLNLGVMYADGRGVQKDDGKAVEWYQKAAAQGNGLTQSLAQSILGDMYFCGKGVETDEVKAFEWYEKSAALGDTRAKSQLAFMYKYRRGVPKDDAKAFEWYRKAAIEGSVAAQCNLGNMYTGGIGVPKDDSQAVEWYRKAAAQMDADAQCNLGYMYSAGRGVPKDDSQAVVWYQKAAAQGHAAAQSHLGFMHSTGRGVPKDDAKAVEWYQKAAAQGYAQAQSHLGFMSSTGRGVPKDDAKAVEWYQKAAAQGYARAQSKLGSMYAEGRGVPKDPTKAAEWYAKAAASQRVTPNEPSHLSPPLISNSEKPADAMLRHLSTDDRLASGSLLVDRLRNYGGKGKLTLDNGRLEDAYVKLIQNRKLVAAFYVRSFQKFTYSNIPDGSYTVVYCTGYGWDGSVRNFARGRHARRYDDPLDYSTRQARDASGATTTTDVVTLTLHKVAYGNAKSSDMSLEDFDQY